ncbi:hypothetical protein LOD99_4769 [Oopsacas minuta]|uniref:Transposase Tc1-like domain-containing protein n=1 Tax=Oopsacas minuta TaxID=111878 RepID=A0AAV7JU13_9METZ|nr:hypothetical protein LOD99_4769 [Oopsacas minuta]
MIEGGMTQKDVANHLSKGIATIKRCWKRHINNQSLNHRPGAGRPLKLNPVAKMIISKSLGKRHQSIRRLSEKLKSKGHSNSKSSVQSYLKKSVGAKPFKRHKQPKLTPKHKENRLLCCQKYRNWSVDNWKCILWSDESPFELFILKPSK